MLLKLLKTCAKQCPTRNHPQRVLSKSHSTWPRRKRPAAPFTTSFWEPAKWNVFFLQPMLYRRFDRTRQTGKTMQQSLYFTKLEYPVKTKEVTIPWANEQTWLMTCINMSYTGTTLTNNKGFLLSLNSEHTETSLLRLQIQSLSDIPHFKRSFFFLWSPSNASPKLGNPKQPS